MRPVLLILLLAVLVGGCAAGGPKVTYVADQRYQPTVVVDRLRAPPNRPYATLAEINWIASSMTRREVEDLLAEEARKLGANAIVFGKSKIKGLRNATEVHSEETNRYSAIAIRYR